MADETHSIQLPLERSWLADIIDAFLKFPRGVGDIESVLIFLMRHCDRDLGSEGEATITRTINNYSVNARDLERSCTHPLFERIGPAEYKLLTYPEAPDLVEIQPIRFVDDAHRRVWEIFSDKSKNNPRWAEMTKRERLEAFAQKLQTNEALQKLLKVYSQPVPSGDLGL